jgi:hypothetical protein
MVSGTFGRHISWAVPSSLAWLNSFASADPDGKAFGMLSSLPPAATPATSSNERILDLGEVRPRRIACPSKAGRNLDQVGA